MFVSMQSVKRAVDEGINKFSQDLSEGREVVRMQVDELQKLQKRNMLSISDNLRSINALSQQRLNDVENVLDGDEKVLKIASEFVHRAEDSLAKLVESFQSYDNRLKHLEGNSNMYHNNMERRMKQMQDKLDRYFYKIRDVIKTAHDIDIGHDGLESRLFYDEDGVKSGYAVEDEDV